MTETLCQTCHRIFKDDWRNHALDWHRAKLLDGSPIWFADVEGTSRLLINSCQEDSA